ncbi:hypothetical protein TNCV_2409901 [Trichonephila clavipes]|nr:hypothetical protein TNCV_2409901 [Trichonephila clavipes]
MCTNIAFSVLQWSINGLKKVRAQHIFLCAETVSPNRIVARRRKVANINKTFLVVPGGEMQLPIKSRYAPARAMGVNSTPPDDKKSRSLGCVAWSDITSNPQTELAKLTKWRRYYTSPI